MTIRSTSLTKCLPIVAAALTGALLVQTAFAQPDRGPRRPADRIEGRPAERMGGARFGQGGFQPAFMPGRFQHVLEPDYRMRDGALLAQELNFERGQRPIIELLLEDYRAAFDEAAEPLRDAVARARRPRGMFPGGWARGDGPGEGAGLDAAERQELEGIAEAVRTALERRLAGGEEGGQVRSMVIIQRGQGDEGPTVEVTIDGADVPDEVRERAERVAQRIEERLARRLEQVERRRQEAEERAANEPEPLEPEEVVSIAQQFLAKKESLRFQFEQDVLSVLGPDQLELWPEAQALIRRVGRLQLGRLSGEQIDLAAVLRDLQLPQFLHEGLQPLLAQYAVELDAAIAARATALERSDIDIFLAFHEQDFDRMLAVDEKIAARRIAVRNVNDRFAQQIAAAIEHEEWSEKFASAVREQTYPWLNRPTPFTRLVNAALVREELTDEQREVVEDLVARYEAEVALADEKAIAELRESEHLRWRQFIEMLQQMQQGERPARPDMRGVVTQMNPGQERMSVAMRYMRELRDVLPAELLPEPAGRTFRFD